MKSSRDGHQMRMLAREVRSLRERVDSAVALADREVGVRRVFVAQT